MESSAAWLESTLQRVCCGDAQGGLQLDPDTVSSLVSYCELATPEDAAEYLTNIVSHESCNEIVEEYKKRRKAPPSTIKNESGAIMQAYQKPQADETWSRGAAKNVKAMKQKPASAQESRPSSSAAGSSVGSASAASKKPSTGKNRRGTKTISVAEASKLVSFQQGKPCECQATRHGLVNNCLSCGKIICQQEGEGPCSYCGALVLREGSNYAGLEGVAIPVSESEAAAQAFKDRLVEYDRNSASRTTVIDDQSDFFDAADSWISEEDKELLRKKQEAMEKAEEERRKRVVVTIDLLGRKVVMAGGEKLGEAASQSILLAPQEIKEKFRMTPSPSVREPPVYVSTAGAESRAATGANKGGSFAITGRVQYDDALLAAQLARKLEDLQLENNNEWCRPKIHQASSSFEDASETFECA